MMSWEGGDGEELGYKAPCRCGAIVEHNVTINVVRSIKGYQLIAFYQLFSDGNESH